MPPWNSPKASAAAATSKTVAVDCAAGDSIAKALEQPGDPLTIDIRGFCDEDVVLSRDRVTLRGSDPDLDVGRLAQQGELNLRHPGRRPQVEEEPDPGFLQLQGVEVGLGGPGAHAAVRPSAP